MKVIVFGCQQIAVDFLHFLIDQDDVEVPLVVTYELPLDVTYGYASVLQTADEANLRVEMLPRITARLIKEIREIEPDIIFSVFYRKIFPQDLLSVPRLGCVNIHPSMLPAYRGPVPTAWSILRGETETGITIHMMDKGIDTGDILVQKSMSIDDDETGYDLFVRSMEVGAEMLAENFYDIVNERVTPRKQSGTGSYFGRMTNRSTIDWQSDAKSIKNMVRVNAHPYSRALAVLYNKYCIVNRVSIYEKGHTEIAQGCGRIAKILEDERLVVSCADGFVVLEEYVFVPGLTDLERGVYLKMGNRFS